MINNLELSDKLLLEEYLFERLNSESIKRRLSIVYDITYYCNLSCKGCAVNAKNQRNDNNKDELNQKSVKRLLEKIKKHIEKNNIYPFFINYGGGEPFLRNDFIDIIKYSSHLFGKDSVGIDTNGTISSFADILEIKDCVSYLGISIDGPEDYHNKWRGKSNVENPFRKSLSLISKILTDSVLSEILEVSSVATKENIDQLPFLIANLDSLGVKNYSVHRSFPVGRMSKYQNSVPNAEDYLKLALLVARANKQYDINCHFHHSLESIYGSIFLNRNTYIGDKVVGNPDSRSSFGIDPSGNIYFDPWCMVYPWNNLTGGNILNNDFNFDLISSGKGIGLLSVAKNYSLKETRCNSCELNCSGGSRIAASAHYLSTLKKYNLSDLLIGLSKIDPACPLYKIKNARPDKIANCENQGIEYHK